MNEPAVIQNSQNPISFAPMLVRAKFFLFFLLILLNTCPSLAQERIIVSTNLFKTVRFTTSYSYSGNLYAGLENELIVSVDGVPSRSIVIYKNYDTSHIRIKEIWLPWVNSSPYMSRQFVAKLGGYNASGENSVEKFVESDSIQWEKRWILFPDSIKDYKIDLYEKTDTALVFINSIFFKTYMEPKPEYNIYFPNSQVSKQELLALDSIQLTNLQDFVYAKDRFGIRNYQLIIYNHRNKPIYNQDVYCALIPPKAKRKIKKLRSGAAVVFSRLQVRDNQLNYVKVLLRK